MLGSLGMSHSLVYTDHDGVLGERLFLPYPAAMVSTGRRTAASGLPLPPDVTNAASISGSIPSGLTLHRATMASSQAAPNAPKNGTRILCP